MTVLRTPKEQLRLLFTYEAIMFSLRLWITLWISTTLYSQNHTPIVIEGWPEQASRPGLQATFGNDPVLGRLTCPPLTRLHLKHKKSHSLVAAQTHMLSPTHWRYTLRKGIYWWDAQAVSIDDFIEFFKNELQRRQLLKQVKIEKFGQTHVDLHWDTAPEFGAFFLNGQPFYKKDTKHPVGFQCAGNYQPTEKNWLELKTSPGYKQHRRPLRFVQKSDKDKPDLKFQQPFQVSVQQEHLQKPPHCQHSTPLYGVTILRWNPLSSLLADKNLRRLLAHSLPRHTLAKVGAMGMATPSLHIIPPNHPGALPKVQQMTLTQLGDRLDKLGYKKNHPDHTRTTPNGQPLSLSIKTPVHNIMTQVLHDNLRVLGIEATFDKKGLDITVESMWLPWPGLDLDGLIPAKRMSQSYTDALQNYRTSLSHLQPNFKLLKPIQEHLHSEAHLSAILHHKACLDVQPHIHYGGQLDTLDPDWFRDIIEIANRN